METLKNAWRVRIVVRLSNGNDSEIDCFNEAEAQAEVLRLRMAENPSILRWHFEPVSFTQWQIEKGLTHEQC